MKPIELHNLKLKEVDYIVISEESQQKISELLAQKKVKESDVVGVLVTLNQKGCAGLAYKIEYAKPNINLFDGFEVVRHKNFDVFINPKISLYLIGTKMEYKNDILKSGFFFDNPNSKGSCGCGESFFV
jgi:iron-sulfur cluster assembly protein